LSRAAATKLVDLAVRVPATAVGVVYYIAQYLEPVEVSLVWSAAAIPVQVGQAALDPQVAYGVASIARLHSNPTQSLNLRSTQQIDSFDTPPQQARFQLGRVQLTQTPPLPSSTGFTDIMTFVSSVADYMKAYTQYEVINLFSRDPTYSGAYNTEFARITNLAQPSMSFLHGIQGGTAILADIGQLTNMQGKVGTVSEITGRANLQADITAAMKNLIATDGSAALMGIDKPESMASYLTQNFATEQHSLASPANLLSAAGGSDLEPTDALDYLLTKIVQPKRLIDKSDVNFFEPSFCRI
jgi:hypothetical protein